ncbi:mycofactocin-coupled SDR family oxidoreductase [Pseudonocardia xishanensis]|uniref:Mycofactocin-coupled SDR family oxidoreductase n=1 Tax=Pseudonocardia xishanensis TaxID=630995 RepID=A0ABP8REZ3_9PSEU
MTRLLERRVAFVSGVARGQGRSHAVRLAEEGADIIGVDVCANDDTVHYDLATEDDLAETADLVAATGRRAFLRKADVREFDQVDAVVRQGVAEFGRLDVVVVNAGIFSAGPGIELSERTWRTMVDVNLTGAWITARACVPHIRAGGSGGSVVFTSSVCGLITPSGLAHYNATKFGVVGLMRTLAAELGPEFIRVNSVNPGNVDTPMIDNDGTRRLFMPGLEHPTRADARKPDSPYVVGNAIPVPWVEAVDVSNAVVFLASDRARYISGVALPVDAGYLAKQ